MKSILLTIFVFLSFHTFGQQSIENIFKPHPKLIQQLKTYDSQQIINEVHDFCYEEMYHNPDNGNIELISEGNIHLDLSDDFNYLRLEDITYEDDENFQIIQEAFSSHPFLFNNNFLNDDLFLADSIIIYLVDDNDEQVLLGRSLTIFNGDLPLKTLTYLDLEYAIGIPLGYQLFSETRFYYDGNNMLISKAEDIFDFDTFSGLIKQDSITYEYNSDGKIQTETQYYFEETEYILSGYTVYEYQANQITITDSYAYDGVEIASSQTVDIFDDQDRITESKGYNTYDNGTTWILESKYTYYYDNPTLALGLENRNTYEYDSGNGLQIESETTYTNCGDPNAIHELASIDAKAWFTQDQLIIDINQNDIDHLKLNLYDIHGNLILTNIITNGINVITSHQLSSGAYFITLKSNDKIYTQKAIKI